ncbi:leucine-rich repeat protein kinase family protein [Anaeramoeba flamelloides]|uniref:Leucine-rich repeat protein kinase family protein n=1 Tax=Anaeramoeba flamelloides TaxID=1746091 RepID=A0ABQ8YZ01_9EUKA|nr:leucine-rich repeat protein kinase family protein [Anaeramoeba flamelloides]
MKILLTILFCILFAQAFSFPLRNVKINKKEVSNSTNPVIEPKDESSCCSSDCGLDLDDVVCCKCTTYECLYCKNGQKCVFDTTDDGVSCASDVDIGGIWYVFVIGFVVLALVFYFIKRYQMKKKKQLQHNNNDMNLDTMNN